MTADLEERRDADLVRVGDDREWDAFVASSPHGSAFATSGFLRAQAVRSERWFLIVDGRPAAAAVQCLAGDEVLDAPRPSVMYQSPMLAGWAYDKPTHRLVKWETETLGLLLATLAVRYPRLSFATHPNLRDIRAIQWFRYHEPAGERFRIEPMYTAILDLEGASEASLLSAMRFSRRYEMKQARKSGVRFELAASEEPLVALVAQMFERQGRPWEGEARVVLPALAAAALSERTGEVGACVMPDGTLAAAALFLYDRSTAYYLAGATASAYRHTGVGSQIVMEFVMRAIARGCRRVDLCGINSPQRGDFKTSLNATSEVYFSATWR